MHKVDLQLTWESSVRVDMVAVELNSLQKMAIESCQGRYGTRLWIVSHSGNLPLIQMWNLFKFWYLQFTKSLSSNAADMILKIFTVATGSDTSSDTKRDALVFCSRWAYLQKLGQLETKKSLKENNQNEITKTQNF